MKLHGFVVSALAALAALGPAAYAQVRINATTEDGRSVVLSADGTWKFREVAPFNSTRLQEYRKAPNATTRVAVPYGDVVIWIDAAKWKESSRDGGRIVFTHSGGKLFAAAFSENVGGIPTSAMKEVAHANAKQQDPSAALVRDERRSVNGRDLLYVELKASRAGIPLHFAGYYHGGAKSDFQLVVFTVEGEFTTMKPEIEEFISGVEVREPSSPEPVRGEAGGAKGVLSSGVFRLNYRDDARTSSRVEQSEIWQLSRKKGGAYARFIPERLDVTTEILVKVALDRVRELDPDMRVVKQETRMVGGVEVKEVRFDASVKGVPLAYLGYYYGAKMGAVQVLTWTGKNNFSENEGDMRELLNGLMVEQSVK